MSYHPFLNLPPSDIHFFLISQDTILSKICQFERALEASERQLSQARLIGLAIKAYFQTLVKEEEEILSKSSEELPPPKRYEDSRLLPSTAPQEFTPLNMAPWHYLQARKSVANLRKETEKEG